MNRRRVVVAFVGGLCSVVVMKEIAEIHFAPVTPSSPAVVFTGGEREKGHSDEAWPIKTNPAEVRDLLGDLKSRAQGSSPIPHDHLGAGGRGSAISHDVARNPTPSAIVTASLSLQVEPIRSVPEPVATESTGPVGQLKETSPHEFHETSSEPKQGLGCGVACLLSSLGNVGHERLRIIHHTQDLPPPATTIPLSVPMMSDREPPAILSGAIEAGANRTTLHRGGRALGLQAVRDRKVSVAS